MIRKIITIDANRCNGCGICVDACHEGAIAMKEGKAILLRDDYCDGLGDCLPACPANAISFEEREALPYDEAAVMASLHAKASAVALPHPGVCQNSPHHSALPAPGPSERTIRSNFGEKSPAHIRNLQSQGKRGIQTAPSRQWPVQLRLVPPDASFFHGADLLLAADCCAYAHPAFRETFMEERVTLIGCPKLDPVDYSEKLTVILEKNEINGLMVARMSVPCCGGIEAAARKALHQSGKNIPLAVVTIDVDGYIK